MQYCHHALSVVVNFSHLRLLLWNRWTEFNETWQEARSHRLVSSWCFFFRVDQKKQDDRPGRSVKKVAHWTQVNDIWPFGPLVLSWIYLYCSTLCIGKLLILCKPSARYIFIDNEIQYVFFKGMVYFGWYIDTYISLHILLIFLLTFCFFLANPSNTQNFTFFVTLVPFAVWSW